MSQSPEICSFATKTFERTMIFLRKEWSIKISLGRFRVLRRHVLRDKRLWSCTSIDSNSIPKNVLSARSFPAGYPGYFPRIWIHVLRRRRSAPTCSCPAPPLPLPSFAESFTRFLALSHFSVTNFARGGRVAVSTPLSEHDDYDDTDSISVTHCRAKESSFEPQTVYFSMEYKIDSHIRTARSEKLLSRIATLELAFGEYTKRIGKIAILTVTRGIRAIVKRSTCGLISQLLLDM